jgi:hypothetical protein
MGVFLFVFGVIGLVAAFNKSHRRPLLLLFCVLLTLLFLTLLILSAYALSRIGLESASLGKSWQAADPDQRQHVQLAYRCCGAYYRFQLDAIPCGRYDSTTRQWIADPNYARADGWADACIELMAPDWKRMQMGFGVAGIVMAIYLLIGLCMTGWLIWRGRRHVEEERSRGEG